MKRPFSNDLNYFIAIQQDILEDVRKFHELVKKDANLFPEDILDTVSRIRIKQELIFISHKHWFNDDIEHLFCTALMEIQLYRSMVEYFSLREHRLNSGLET